MQMDFLRVVLRFLHMIYLIADISEQELSAYAR